ncbi:MAG: NnrS family protein [Magnetococcales bacterium]|nr:NnrS family protein [Magnetococcales bacterium]
MTAKKIPIGPAPEPPPPQLPGPVWLAYGFRPFFLLAPLYGALAMALWLALQQGWIDLRPGPPPVTWHGHEMIFGFVGAAAAGFLLTAMPNWCQQTPLRGKTLLAITILWLAGRLVWWAGPESWTVGAALVDLAFPAALTLAAAWPVWRSRRWHQGIFPLLLAVWCGANGLVHGDLLAGGTGTAGLWLGMWALVWVIVLFGGRMLPAFTQAATLAAGQRVDLRPHPVAERLADWSLAPVLAGSLAWPEAPLHGVFLVAAGLLQALRLWSWRPWETLGHPLVWSLHVGYGFLTAGLLASGGMVLGLPLEPGQALHLLTAGAFGVTVASIMTRVTLAHTGRPLVVGPLTRTVLILLALGALVRVLGVPDWNLLISGGLWIVCYTILALLQVPRVLQPRADGKPG